MMLPVILWVLYTGVLATYDKDLGGDRTPAEESAILEKARERAEQARPDLQ